MTTQKVVRELGWGIVLIVLAFQSVWVSSAGITGFYGFADDPAWMWYLALVGFALAIFWPKDSTVSKWGDGRMRTRLHYYNTGEDRNHGDVNDKSRALT